MRRAFGGPTATFSNWRILQWQIQNPVDPTTGNMTK